MSLAIRIIFATTPTNSILKIFNSYRKVGKKASVKIEDEKHLKKNKKQRN
jgi:hypothetical protein